MWTLEEQQGQAVYFGPALEKNNGSNVLVDDDGVGDSTASCSPTPPHADDHGEHDDDDDDEAANNVLNLLQIAKFLTDYQSFYTLHTVGPILVPDLHQVLYYRAWKRKLAHWKEQAAIYKVFHHHHDDEQGYVAESAAVAAASSSVPENPYQIKIDECLEKLAVYQPKAGAAAAATTARLPQKDENVEYKNYERIVKIDKLWRRMQVWTCKALAQHVLVVTTVHENADDDDDTIPKNAVVEAEAPSPSSSTTSSRDNNSSNLQTQYWSYPLSLPLSSHAMMFLPHVPDVKQRGKLLLPFAKIFDQTYNNHSHSNSLPNCLLVPPNHYNCREYARICSMMAQLPNQRAMQAVHVSPLVLNTRRFHHLHNNNNNNNSNISATGSVKFHWQAPHLVALWIRAQRSPQALRHLVQLFHVTTTTDPNFNDNPQQQQRHHDDNQQYRVEFQGNHKLIYKRSILCSHLADKICTWAIVNQVQCTYPQFVKYFQQQQASRREQEQRRKPMLTTGANKRIIVSNGKRTRPTVLVDQQAITEKSKRRRKAPSDMPSPTEETTALQDSTQETELHRDCQAFLLRTWARRHAKDLQMLYQHPWQIAQQQQQHQQPKMSPWRSPSPLVSMDILKAHLKQHLPNTTDHNLLRIERRIGIGKYDTEKAVSLQKTVTNLVQAFRQCLIKERKRRLQSPRNNGDGGGVDDEDEDEVLIATAARLQDAQDDFERTCSDFDGMWNEAGAISAARSLFAWTGEALSTTSSTSSMTTAFPAGKAERAILSSAPAPWLNICCKCNAAVKEEGSYRMCACCEQVWHSSCEDDGNEEKANQTALQGFKEFISSFPPLQEMFQLQVPKNPDFYLPSYCADRASEVTWTLTRVQLTRTYKPHDAATTPESSLLRSPLRPQLEAWGLGFFETRLGTERVDELLAGNLPLWDWQKVGPLFSIPHVGLMISKIFEDSPSARSSIQVGDVIVAIRIGESDDSSTAGDDEKFCPRQMHTLAHFTNREDFARLFRQGSKELDLVIQRPSRPILQEAETCLHNLVQAMEISLAVLDDTKSRSLHFCPSCRCETVNSTTAKHSVRDTLRNCRAVIRRLGSEWYGRYFWDENHVRADHVLSLDVDGDDEGDKLAEVLLQSVSLGRLDQMMEDLLDREEISHPVMDQDSSMSFFVGNHHRLKWAPAELETSPLTLLCRGMNLLINDYKNWPAFQDSSGTTLVPTMEMRKALCADFVQLFACWCLGLPAGANISLKGPYPHALFAADPAPMRRCCSSCQLRELPPECDGPYVCVVCQLLVDVKPTSSTSDDEHCCLSRVDVQIQRYQERARLVGCSILLLPGDPLLKGTADALSADNITIEHCNRPFEFIVVSYLPSSLKECSEEENEGVFHLLPIVNQLQLKYLLQRCKFRRTDQDGLRDETIHKWKKDGLLDLLGVLQLSFKELTAKINSTARIVDSVSDEVARQARCTCDKTMAQLKGCFEQVPDHDKENDDDEKVIPCSNPRCCACAEVGDECSLPWRHATTINDTISTPLLIDAALQTRSPIMLEMVKSQVSPLIDGDMPVDERVDPVPLELTLTAEEMMFLPRKDHGRAFFSRPGGSLRACYSDLYFRSQADMLRFEQSASAGLENQSPHHTAKMTVVLSNRMKTPFSFGGWGFELVRGQAQQCIRVGRIHPHGPAFASGLRSGDELVSVNGRRLADIGSSFEWVCAILSVPSTMFFPHAGLLGTILHWISTEQRSLGPLILEIRRASHRPRDAETMCTEQQEMARASIPPQPSRQAPIPQQALRSVPMSQIMPQTHQQPIRAPHWHAERQPQPPQQQVLHPDPRFGNFPPRRDFGWDQQHHGRSATVDQPIVHHLPEVMLLPIPVPLHHPNVAPPGAGHPYRDIDFAWITESFRNIKLQLSQCANYLSAGDLHRSFMESVLTVAETSVLMTAIAEDQPMLGFRLLTPRYSVRNLVGCLKLLSRENFVGFLRKLPAGFWGDLLRKDFQRSENEDARAPIAFVDSIVNSFGNFFVPRYKYRMPTRVFPIDQFFAEFLRKTEPMQLQAHNGPGFSLQDSSGLSFFIGPGRVEHAIDLTIDDDAERIRGGGHEKFLQDLPQSEWNEKLVKGRISTERENNNSTKTKFFGRVKFPSGSCSADDKVDVCVMYLRNMGIITPFYNIKKDPRKLKLVDEMSNEGIKALNAEKMKRKTTSASDRYMASIDPLNDHEILGVTDPLNLLAAACRTGESPVGTEREEAPPPKALDKSATAPEKPGWPEKPILEFDKEYVNQEEELLKPAAAITHPTHDMKARDSGSIEKSMARIGKKGDANELVKRLCDSQTWSICPLGFLPDGRSLYWFRDDPVAVYVSSSSPLLQDPIGELALTQATHKYDECVATNFEQHRNTLFSLRPCRRGAFSCLWGCSVISGDGVGECRSFESIPDLRDHLRLHHCYIEADTILIFDRTSMDDLIRVDDPAKVTKICRGLAASAAAKCSPLRTIFAQTALNEQVAFSGDRLFSKQARNQVIESILASPGDFDSSCMRLYLRLARLFQINGEKAYGLSKDEMLHAITLCHGPCDGQNNASLEDPAGCCSLGCERVLVTENEDYRDTGCLPIGDICLNETDAYPTDCGDVSLRDAKSMLLALASNIPESIQKMKSNSKARSVHNIDVNHICPQMQLWSDLGYVSWKRFVSCSQDVRSLGQAFVALVFSLNFDLPEWWVSEGIGWSPLQASHSLSSLLHHLQVFEAALMESIAIASLPLKAMNEYIPQDLASFPYDKQVSLTLERSKDLGLDRFKGEHNSFCSICQDGGDVLCCELCANVGHASCYNLADSNVNDFVCYACMTDVATMYPGEVLGEVLDM